MTSRRNPDESGSGSQTHEASPDPWGRQWLERLRQDVRYGVRTLRRTPGFTSVAILCLSLGIGANAAVFNWMEAVVLRPYPGVVDQDRLVVVVNTSATQPGYDVLSWLDFKDLERTTSSFSSFIVAKITGATLTGGERAERLVGQLVTANFLSALGVRPALGRGFRPDEDLGRNPRPVVVISYRLWQDRFGGDSAIIGRTINLNNVPHAIVGVMPPEFLGTFVGYAMQFWVPASQEIVLDPTGYRLDDRTDRWVEGFARLKPGVPLARAQADIDAAGKRLAAEFPKEDRGRGALVLPLRQAPFDNAKQVLPMLRVAAVVAIFVLIIACANVANLLLVRALGRRHEMTVRLAVGAGRARLVRQLITEGAMLSGAATALGLLFAFWSRGALSHFYAPRGGVSLVFASSFDARVLGASLTVGILSTAVFAIVPAFQASNVDMAGALKSESRGNLGSHGSGRIRGGLVSAQVCLSFVLLVGSGLVLQALSRLQRQTTGFSTDNVVTTGINLYAVGYDTAHAHQFYDALLLRIRELRGVESAAIAYATPFSNRPYDAGPIDIDGYAPPQGERPSAAYNRVSPGYFSTFGIRLLAGRDFTITDTDSSARVAIISRGFATRYFGSASPLGRRLTLRGRPMEIVGVVNDIRYQSLVSEPQPLFYVPLLQDQSTSTSLFVRSAAGTAISSSIVDAVHAVDPNVSPYEVITLGTLVTRAAVPQRIAASLVAILSAVALALSAIGLYGVISYTVSQGTRELGLRMALGATPSELLSHVVSGGFRLIAIGLLFGLGLALTTTRLLGDLLYRTSPWDPIAFSAAIVVMSAAALAACLLPGIRATRIDPVTALRG